MTDDLSTRARAMNLAADTARHAAGAGADFADAAISWGRQISVTIDGNDIRLSEQHERWAFSVRAFVAGGMGHSGGDGEPTPDALRACLADATEMARLAGRDPDFAHLPPPADPAATEQSLRLHDDAIAAMTLADAVRLASDNIARARDIDGGVTMSGDVAFTGGWGVLANSRGVAVGGRGTFGEVSLFAVARDGDDVGSFSDYTAGRHWNDLHIAPLAAECVAGARRYQHARAVQPQTMTLLLGPLASAALLGALASAASAESLRRKRSLFTGRVGRRVASPLLTLRDQPLAIGGVSSSAFDNEGSPRLPVTIFDAGVLAEPLNNHYNAHLAGVRNNGHGTRRGTVAATNLQAQPGDRTAAQLIAEIDEGVLLENGSLEPDLAGGDISAALDFAFKIERGRLAYPLAGAMVAGDLLDLLANIDAVSSDYRSDPGMICPAIRIRDVQIIGGA